MGYNFQANIGADIKEFQSKMKQVDAAIRDAATGADAGIGADIKDFMRGALTVHAELDELERGDTKVEIDADTSPALRAMAFLRLQLAALSANNIKIKISAAWNNYRTVMGSIANFSRNIGEVTGIMGRGGLMFLSPAAVPVIASTVGLLGQLGPLVGTVLGSTFALATSFGAAGIGAAGFAAVAIPALKGVFDKAGEITDLEMKIADAKAVGDLEKANEHLAEMDRIFKGMSGPQLEAHSALRDFQGTFSQLVKDMEPGVLTAFGGALTGITSIFGLARPMIENVVESVNNLMDSFNSSLEAQDVKDFFSFLGDFAGPALEAIVKAAGNFTMGLFNMMEAFGPLATETQNSFLKMSESFRQWADGLSESEKFQSFVDYVSENMPKIRSIFSDAIQGIINTFAAFAPSSATMMSGLQDLMERFKNFSATLSENQGFQRFVDYVKESGPVVVSTIGSLITFIVNLGIALAPVGSFLLGLVQSFLNWANSMMQAHPWLGKIAAVAFVVVAGLFAIAPAVLLVNAMFGGLIIGMIKLVARMTITAVVWVAKWALMATQSLFQAARMAAAWFIALGPVGWITGIVIGLAILVIANWDKISAWTSKTWTAISNYVVNAVTVIMSLISSRFPALYAIISSAMTMAQSIISAVWSYIKGTFSNTLAFLKALVKGDFSGMRTAIQNQMELAKATIQRIWDAVKGYLTTLLGVLLAKFGEMFAKIVTKIREKMAEGVKAVSEFVGKMPGEVTKFVGDMLSAGGDLVNGLIEGIKGMGTSAINAITGVVDGVVGKAKSLLKIKSPSRVFMEIGDYVGQGLAKGITGTVKQVESAGAKLVGKLTKAFNDKETTRVQKVALQSTKNFANQQLSVLKNIAKQREAVASKIKEASKKLADAVKVRDDFAKTVADNAKSFASVANIDAKTGTDFATQLKAKLKAITDFQANIKRLQKSGLNATTLQDLINGGVEGGGSKAATLAFSSTDVIKQINSTQSAINKASSSLGKDAANQFYGLGVDAAKGIVKGLESQAAALEKSANKISDTLVKAVKKKLNIHSPSRVFAEIGGFVSEGLAIGVDSKAGMAVKNVAAMAAGMTNAFNPQLAMADMNASANLDTSISRADMGVVRKSFAAEVGPVEVEERDIYLNVDGRRFAKFTAKPMQEELDRNAKQMNASKRGAN